MTPRFEPFTSTKCCSKQKQAKKLALFSGQKFQAQRFLSIPKSSLTDFGWALKRNQPKTHTDKEWALTLTTLGIFVTISVKASMPLSSLVPAEAPASNKILAHSALLVSAASYEVNDTKDVKLVSEPKRYVTAK